MAMLWRRSRKPETRAAILLAAWLAVSSAIAPADAAPVKRIRVIDADSHSILLNRNGVITVLICTSEDSQEAARDAGVAMYPFQGRTDFQLIVAVDLRGSLANWAPSIAVNRMRSSLDGEANELKPYYLKNGNRANPRGYCHVIPDFDGRLFALLGFPSTSKDLRAIVYAADGREFKRFEKVDNMNALYNSVRAAIAEYIALRKSRQAAAPPVPDTRSSDLSAPTPPLPPEKPVGP